MNFRLFLTIAFSYLVFTLSAQITEMSPTPERVTNNAVVEGYVNGVPYVYSFAGLDSTKLYSGIHLRSFRYSTQTDQWESIPPLPDALGKIAASASRVGDLIYIIGGYHVFSNGNETSSDKVHIYDPQTNSYLPDGTAIPVPIDDQVQAVWRDSLIYVVTGWSNSQNVTNVQIYNPSTDQWSQGTPVPNGSTYPAFGAAGLIFNDTIYYFGGARNGDFAIQKHMRKGIINPDNPTEIEWSSFILDSSIKAYRPGAFIQFQDHLFWIGGSDNTYNYNGIAYNNGQGVEPNHRLLYLHHSNNTYQTHEYPEIPMDLRGVAFVNDTILYIAGGMESGQIVSNKTLKLGSFPLLVKTFETASKNVKIDVFPNPVNQKMYIKIDDLEICKDWVLKIFDSKGSKIKESKLQSCQAVISIGELPNGVYQLAILINGKIISKQFVKN